MRGVCGRRVWEESVGGECGDSEGVSECEKKLK